MDKEKCTAYWRPQYSSFVISTPATYRRVPLPPPQAANLVPDATRVRVPEYPLSYPIGYPGSVPVCYIISVSLYY